MKTFVFILTLLVITHTGFSQETNFKPIDTLETESGTMLIYANRTWVYLDEAEFEGVMNQRLHEMVCTDSVYNYRSIWTNEDVITCTTNDVSIIKDTLWMCILDSLHTNYAMPFDGPMTSKYGYRHGRRHNGVDIDLETGDTIYAAFDGKIRYAKYHDHGFGNLIVMRHYNGLETYYAHCSKLLVAPNQDVKAGEPIGLGGTTGRSTGSHLHFEVRFYDNPIDPELIFDFKKKKIKDENFFVHSGVFDPNAKSSTTSNYTSSSSSSNKPSPPINKNARSHKVRSGENLWTIARKYGTTVDNLCRLNKLTETDIIHIGQSIRLK